MFLSYDTVEAFAVKRNPVFSFPYLKENGELLSICVDSGFLIEPRAVELYVDFYKNAFKLTELYPQYYRFTLAMATDLEKVGMTGHESRKISRYVKENKLWQFDTSDTRKLETLSILQSKAPLIGESAKTYEGLIKRFDSFICNPDWYKKFNKPLFYDLTHIVFFLTDNGNKPLPLKNNVHVCLMYMGFLCLLDNDADLLSEVCICLRYINKKIPEYWDKFIQKNLEGIKVTYYESVSSAMNPAVDEYHIYLVLNWYQALQNRTAFNTRFKSRTPSFSITYMPESLLSKLSAYVHEYHFTAKEDKACIESFLSKLNEGDVCHWQAALNSTGYSHDVVDKFLPLS